MYIIKDKLDFFLRYLLQNHLMYSDEVHWILSWQDQCLMRYKKIKEKSWIQAK